MKLEHAKRSNREAIVELRGLSGHPNYIPRLAEWAAVDRRRDDEVYVFSYRHKGGEFSSTDGMGDRYLSANYEWALDYLDNKDNADIGWVDILCTCHDEETLMDAFGYMGDLYLNNKVVNNYMTSPTTFAEVQTRGWIYQESAFPAIDVEGSGWNDEAWSDISHYRVVADLILRRGFQGLVKTQALDVKDIKNKFNKIVEKEKAKPKKNERQREWWENVERYIDMICDPVGLGIALDLYGLHELADKVDTDVGIAPVVVTQLQELTQSCYNAVVAELKSSLRIQATSSLLGYFAVGAIKGFLSSELAMESDRDAAVFGVLRVLSNYVDLDQSNLSEEVSEDEDAVDSILKYIWTLAYPKGEIIASPVRSASHCLAGLGSVEAIEGDSITPHIPHLSTFVPHLPVDKNENGAKLFIGTTRLYQDQECSVEIYADENKAVLAIRIIPKSYWNYDEVVARVPKRGTKHIFR